MSKFGALESPFWPLSPGWPCATQNDKIFNNMQSLMYARSHNSLSSDWARLSFLTDRSSTLDSFVKKIIPATSTLQKLQYDWARIHVRICHFSVVEPNQGHRTLSLDRLFGQVDVEITIVYLLQCSIAIKRESKIVEV